MHFPIHTRRSLLLGVLALAAPWTASARETAAPVAVRPAPRIARHHAHIGLVALAYANRPMSQFEDYLLRNYVDLVIGNQRYMNHVHAVAPTTPQLLYTNVTSVYEGLLTDWLFYADQHGISREAAFYHVTTPTRWRGDSPSSRPVAWFWRVLRGRQNLKDVTWEAYGKHTRLSLGASGEAIYLGYPERFGEINVPLLVPAGSGWKAAIEYLDGVEAPSGVTHWKPLAMRDTTQQFRHSGKLSFTPPADWKPVSLAHVAPLYFIRIRTTAQVGPAPVAGVLTGRDYAGAQGGIHGMIPVFDDQADKNHDGYLDDEEYQHRASGKDARFLYESRLFAPNYGQMRFATNPADRHFRAWAIAHHMRTLRANPLAGGFLFDNSSGESPTANVKIRESVTHYADDYAEFVQAIREAIFPHLILMNTSGSWNRSSAVIRKNPAYFEEFAIRPLSHNWQSFRDMAGLVASRQRLTKPAPLAVLDSYPSGGSPTDPRTQLATLAYYYLLADPEATFLCLYGGYEPSTSWKRHWVPALAFDVGKPLAPFKLMYQGHDPTNAKLTYHVYGREYEHALVLYKPLSFGGWSGPKAGLGEATATTHSLGTDYRPLRADGTLGEPISRVMLRNGEGAILIKTKETGARASR